MVTENHMKLHVIELDFKKKMLLHQKWGNWAITWVFLSY